MKSKGKTLIILGLLVSLVLGVLVHADGGQLDTIDGNGTQIFSASTRNVVVFSESDYYPTSEELSRYPFTSSTVTNIGFDVMYGVDKSVLTYKGELPKFFEAESTDAASDVWKHYRATDYPSNGAQKQENSCSPTAPGKCLTFSSGLVDPNAKWLQTTSGSFSSTTAINELTEYANKETDVRLIALLYTNRTGGLNLVNGDNIFASLIKFISRLSMQAVNLAFSARQLRIGTILSNITTSSGNPIAAEIGEKLVEVFIYGPSGTISPYFLICLLGLLLSITTSAYHYVKGNGAPEKFRETMILAAVGFIIIGAAVVNKAYTLTSPLETLVDRILYTSVSSPDSKDIWATTTDSKKDIDIQNAVDLTQQSKLKKIYIDLTIQQQFNSSIDDLKIGGSILDKQCTLYAYDTDNGKSIDAGKYFDNNLGYYFWFANSDLRAPVRAKAEANAMKTGGSTQTIKIEQVLNCLQTNLDGKTGLQKAKIVQMVKALANSTGWSVNYILFSINCVLLAITLFLFCIPLLLSRLEIFMGTLGLAIAGPLFLINSKKTVSIGKSILFLFVFGMLKLTVYGVLITIIVYLSEVFLQANTTSLIVSMVLLFALVRFTPSLKATLKKSFDNMEQKLAPDLSNARRSLRRSSGEAFNNLSTGALGTTVDDEGNVRASLIGSLSGMIATSMKEDGHKQRVRKMDAERRQGERAKLSSNAASAISKDYADVNTAANNLQARQAQAYNDYITDEYFNGNKNYNLNNSEGILNLDLEQIKARGQTKLATDVERFRSLNKTKLLNSQKLSTLRDNVIRLEQARLAYREAHQNDEIPYDQQEAYLALDGDYKKAKKAESNFISKMKKESDEYSELQDRIYNTIHTDAVKNGIDNNKKYDFAGEYQNIKLTKDNLDKKVKNREGNYRDYDSRIAKDRTSVEAAQNSSEDAIEAADVRKLKGGFTKSEYLELTSNEQANEQTAEKSSQATTTYGKSRDTSTSELLKQDMRGQKDDDTLVNYIDSDESIDTPNVEFVDTDYVPQRVGSANNNKKVDTSTTTATPKTVETTESNKGTTQPKVETVVNEQPNIQNDNIKFEDVDVTNTKIDDTQKPNTEQPVSDKQSTNQSSNHEETVVKPNTERPNTTQTQTGDVKQETANAQQQQNIKSDNITDSINKGLSAGGLTQGGNRTAPKSNEPQHDTRSSILRDVYDEIGTQDFASAEEKFKYEERSDRTLYDAIMNDNIPDIPEHPITDDDDPFKR